MAPSRVALVILCGGLLAGPPVAADARRRVAGSTVQTDASVATAASGTGLFWPYTTRPVTGRPEAVAIADVNGDGRNDVLVTTSGPDYSPWLHVYHQLPSGELAAVAVKYPAIENPYSLDVGDLDGDGRIDVVIGSSPYPNPYNGGRPRLVIRRQNEMGTLDMVKVYVNVSSAFVKVGDLNSDGRLDVVGIDQKAASADVFLQNADGTWADPVTYAVVFGDGAPWEVDVGDVNGDGRDDIVVVSAMASEDHIGILPQQPDGTIGNAVYHPLSRRTGPIAVGDANGDGLDDVVAAHRGASIGYEVGILAQNVMGTLDPLSSFPSASYADALELADVNGDGRQDVLVSYGSQLGVYLQKDDGTLTPEALERTTSTSGWQAQGLAVGDINSDGQPDIVLADFYSKLVVLRHRLPHELALSMVDSPDPVALGASVTYTATVSNNGFMPMTGVSVVHTLPAGLSFVSADPAASCTAAADRVTCALGTLNPGTQATVRISAGVPVRRAFVGSYVASTMVTANESEADLSNNSATVETRYVAPCAMPLADGGFEVDPFRSPWWGEGVAWPRPVCTAFYCAGGAGTAGPRSGAGWGWFGGEAGFHFHSARQHLVLGPGTATLRFFLWNGAQSSVGTGQLRVLMDDSMVFQVAEGTGPYTDGYVPVAVDVSSFADGGTHALRFESVSGYPGITSFSVDDVQITVAPGMRRRTRNGGCP